MLGTNAVWSTITCNGGTVVLFDAFSGQSPVQVDDVADPNPRAIYQTGVADPSHSFGRLVWEGY